MAVIPFGKRGRATLLASLFLAGGCSTAPNSPNLGGLYNRSAQYHGVERNPVIVIPGILGSRLVDAESGQVVWGAFGGGSVDATTPEGARICALPMKRGVPLAELRDAVRSDGALDRLRLKLLFLPWELSAYANLLGALGAGGYRDQGLAEKGAVDYGDEHFTCFQFDYDWRRSNVENAQRLHAFILEKTAYVEGVLTERYGIAQPDVRFDIVAHSMGGLLTRYYLRYGAADLPENGDVPELTWAGAAHVERLIMVATPNAGSLKALEQCRDGLYLPTQARYSAAVLGTMPSLYELLPRPRHGAVVTDGAPSETLDFMDPALWETMEWGLADPQQADVLALLLPDVADASERRAIALDHLRKCLARAKQFHAALDRPATPPPGLSLYLFAGDAVPTLSTFRVDKTHGTVVDRLTAPGDGTVTRQSALMDERQGREWTPHLVSPIAWSDVMFLFTSHIGLTKDPAFTDNVLYHLLEEPRTRSSQAGAL